ncbi:hypothetical protein CYMTET_30752, partial [Cymbomonas tetramitiformis]
AAECFRRSFELDPTSVDAKAALEAEERSLGHSACSRILSLHQDCVYAAAYSPWVQDRRLLLATASLDGTARIWSSDGEAALHVLAAHTDKVTAVVWSLTGSLLATSSLDKSVRVWAISAEGVPSDQSCLQGHTGRVTSLAFHPDEARVATAAVDSTARIWDVPSGRCLHLLEGHTKLITGLALAPHGKLLATVSGDGTIRTWSMRSGELFDVIDWTESGAITQCAFTSPGLGAGGGAVLVTCHINAQQEEGRVLMWDIDRPNMAAPVRGYVRSVPESSDWPFRDKIEDMDLCHIPAEDEHLLAVAGADGKLSVFDAESGVRLYCHHHEHAAPPQGPAVRLPSGHYRHNCGPSANVFKVRFSPSGTYLASTGADFSVKIWRAADGQLLHTFVGHMAQVKCLCWSPDEVILVSTSQDSTIRMWCCKWEDEFKPLSLNYYSQRCVSSCATSEPASCTSAWQEAMGAWN